MALTLNSGAGGETLDTENIALAHLQRIKLAVGASGTDDGDVAAGNPLPVFDGLAIARLVDANYTHQNIRGQNLDIDTAADEDLWDGGGTWVAPTTARLHDIVSTSVNDDGAPAGTGARTVLCEGLDTNGDEQSETVTLNGTTNVPTVNTYTMMHRLTVLTAGSGGVNAGTITATAQTDGTVSCQITAGMNQSSQSIYQVPNSTIGYITRIWGAIDIGSAGDADVELWTQANVADAPMVRRFSHPARAAAPFSLEMNPPLVIATRSIVKLRADVDTDNSVVSGGYDIVLVD